VTTPSRPRARLEPAYVTTAPSGATSGERIASIDALRGFALFGILLVHMVEQYTAAAPPASNPSYNAFSTADQVARGLVGLLFVGKFFAMFSLLFGVSFFIQMDRAAARHVAYQRRFVWRLTVLFAIGLAHHLMYRGDILTIYALLGLALVPLYRASDRTLLILAVLLCFGIPRILMVGTAQMLGQPFSMQLGSEAANEEYFKALKGSSLLPVFASNLSEGWRVKWMFQLGVFGRGYQTLGLFFLGLYLARRRWHESLPARHKTLRRAMLIGFGISVPLVILFASFAFSQGGGPPPDSVSWGMVIGLTLYDIFNVGLMVGFACAFLLLYLRPAPQRLLRHLAPVGRTALTTYVCQSLIGTFFYYGYGLNRLAEVGAATGVLLALIIFAAQIVLSGIWLRYFRFGPIEWVWRSLTVWSVQPFWTDRVFARAGSQTNL
jgi:uncharacterized protein